MKSAEESKHDRPTEDGTAFPTPTVTVTQQQIEAADGDVGLAKWLAQRRTVPLREN